MRNQGSGEMDKAGERTDKEPGEQGKETGQGPRLKSRPSQFLLPFFPVQQPELRVNVFVRLIFRFKERPEHVQPIQ